MTAKAAAITGTGIVAPSTHQVRTQGPFQLRRIRPGITLNQGNDGGFGGLGLVDHAKLAPGVIVGMHEHRNDEIISYMRHGQMQHTDSAGTREVLSSDRLMVMNAGSGFSHEEQVVGDVQIEMLQIFVRPERAEMEPGVQFIELNEAQRMGKWRLLAGPVGSGAPSFVRQAVYLYDAHLDAGSDLQVPSKAGFDRWIYVFDGEAQIAGQSISKHTAIMVSEDDANAYVTASQGSDLVVFLVDRNARFSRNGTMSG
jgi:redox-sensitive bicupin YhaK (pirin superfamily)